MPEGTQDDKTGAAFTDDVLDEKYYGRPAPGVLGRTGLLLGILIGGCLAAFGAWILLFDPLPDAGSDQPVRITADPEPYKVRPDDPGGAEIPNQDRLVYDRLDRRPDTDAPVETLISRPEAPSAPVEPDVVETTPEPAAAPDPAPEALEADSPRVPEPQAPADNTADVALPAETPPAVSAPMPQEPVQAPASVPPQPVTSAGPPSGWSVQLVAMRSEEAALEAWQQVSRAQPDLLGTLSPRVVEADLGERGIFYRLKTGDWAERAPADRLCAALQDRRVDCRVTAP